MIQSVTVTNHLGESLEMILAEPEKSGLAILSITGIGQPKADINITSMAGSDYGSFNSARMTKRNVVMKLKYFMDDIEAARILANKYFPTKKQIKLLFKTDHRESELTGYVESNEPDIFSDKSSCQISIICNDPFLYSKNNQVTVFDGITPLFYFPFSDTTEDTQVDTDEGTIKPCNLQFGEIRIVKDNNIYYVGEGEVGITIEIHASGIVQGLTIYNLDTNERISIDDAVLTSMTGYGIIAQDDIIISTVQGKKSATLIRDGRRINIINALVKNPRPDWFTLVNGDNLFSYTATIGEFDVMLSIKNRILYTAV